MLENNSIFINSLNALYRLFKKSFYTQECYSFILTLLGKRMMSYSIIFYSNIYHNSDYAFESDSNKLSDYNFKHGQAIYYVGLHYSL